MANDEYKDFRKMIRKRHHALWEIAKTGNLDSLSGEEKWLAKVYAGSRRRIFQ